MKPWPRMASCELPRLKRCHASSRGVARGPEVALRSCPQFPPLCPQSERCALPFVDRMQIGWKMAVVMLVITLVIMLVIMLMDRVAASGDGVEV